MNYENDKFSFLFSANTVSEMFFLFCFVSFLLVCLSFENSYTLVPHLDVGSHN